MACRIVVTHHSPMLNAMTAYAVIAFVQNHDVEAVYETLQDPNRIHLPMLWLSFRPQEDTAVRVLHRTPAVEKFLCDIVVSLSPHCSVPSSIVLQSEDHEISGWYIRDVEVWTDTKQYRASSRLPWVLPCSATGLYIKPMDTNDVDQTVRLLNDRRIAECMCRLPFPYTEEDARRTLQDNAAEGTRRYDALVYRHDVVVGGCLLRWDPDATKSVVTVAYWVGVPYWRQGVATCAVRTLVQYARDVLNMDSVESAVSADNPASCGVLEKCGFQRSGVKEKEIERLGVVHDVVYFQRRLVQ